MTLLKLLGKSRGKGQRQEKTEEEVSHGVFSGLSDLFDSRALQVCKRQKTSIEILLEEEIRRKFLRRSRCLGLYVSGTPSGISIFNQRPVLGE